MTEEQQLRIEQTLKALRDADYHIVRGEYSNALGAIGTAQLITSAMMLDDEREAMRIERCAAEGRSTC